MKEIIEFTCTGNQGRSPIAELIARDHLHKIDAVERYEAASSGSLAEKIRLDNVPIGFRLKVIAVAKERGVYTPIELQDINKAIKEGNDTAIVHYFKKAEYQFIQEEMKDRVDVLPMFGIEGIIKEKKEQTIAKPDTIAVLSMANTNNNQVQEIYASSQYNPLIDVLSRYVTGDNKAEIPNSFGLGRKAYIAAVEKLMDYVPKAVDKLVK